MFERGDLGAHAKAGRVDEAQQVEGQRGIALENFLNLTGAGLLAYQIDQLQDGCLTGAYGLALHEDRLCKPIALE